MSGFWNRNVRRLPFSLLRRLLDRLRRLDRKTVVAECLAAKFRTQLEYILASCSDAVFVLGDDQKICIMNAGAERFMGRSALTAMGGEFVGIFDETARGQVQVILDELKVDPAAIARRSMRIAWPGRTPDHPATPVEITITRAGRYGERQYTAIARDIAEIVKSEHTTALLAALVHSSQDAIISFSPDQRILSWNEGAEQMFGFTAKQAIGAPADLLVPEDCEDGPAFYFQQVLTGGTISKETVRRRRDGTLIDVFISVAPIRDAQGETVGISAIMHDITARKQDEARLRQAEIVFSRSRDGLAVTDAGRKIIAVNPAFEAITGYSEREIVGQSFGVLQSGQLSTAQFEAMWGAVEREGSSKGEVAWQHKRGDLVPALLTVSSVLDAGGTVQNYVATLTDISQIKDSERLLEHVAHHDALTDLPNRRLLLPKLKAAIERSKRDGTVGAVLFVDLDRFKIINDSMGHGVGDELLLSVVERFRQKLRPGDVLARFGGDEFVIILEHLEGKADAGRIAGELIECLKERLVVREGSGEVFIGASIGISVFPEDGDDADRLIQNADTALYGAKLAGRGCYRHYDVALTLAASVRVQREARMRRALERDEFVLHYQPLYALDSGRIKGVEALVRWVDPIAGLVPPAEFIPIAEDTGLIVELGEWVLRRACAQMRAWRAMGADIETMAVNLSPRQFEQARLVERLRMILQETQLEPRFLELEITESALAEDGDGVRLKLAAMKLLGIRLAIDDFGTGYSSLSYLRRFPIDKLKVDRTFVRDIDADIAAAEIAAAIVGLGRNLGLEVLGEGVETEEQRQFLIAHGCHTAQGFLFSKPLPAAEVQKLLVPNREAELAAAV